MKRVSYACLVLWLGSVGCSDSASNSVPPPPPLPAPAAPPLAAPSEPPTAAPADATRAELEEAAEKSASAREAAPKASGKKGKPSTSSPKPAPSKPAEPVKPAPSAPVAAPTPAPVIEKPRGKVTIPSTEHVRVQVPSGLQADLDKDPRMQPWANQVVNVIDGCYTKTGASPGTIEVRITMHDSARPDADLGGVPNGLAPVVACATGGLLRTKMPLFTGTEGTRYTVRVVFQ